jgi:Barstar (barnase inhibitor)
MTSNSPRQAAALVKLTSGLFQWPDATVSPSVLRRLDAAGRTYVVVKLDTGKHRTKAEMFKAFQRDLQLPDWFGNNWDALVDALADWAPKAEHRLLIIENVPPDDIDGRHPEYNVEMFLDIVSNVGVDDDRPLVVVVTSPKPLPGLALLPVA